MQTVLLRSVRLQDEPRQAKSTALRPSMQEKFWTTCLRPAGAMFVPCFTRFETVRWLRRAQDHATTAAPAWTCRIEDTIQVTQTGDRRMSRQPLIQRIS